MNSKTLLGLIAAIILLCIFAACLIGIYDMSTIRVQKNYIVREYRKDDDGLVSITLLKAFDDIDCDSIFHQTYYDELSKYHGRYDIKLLDKVIDRESNITYSIPE